MAARVLVKRAPLVAAIAIGLVLPIGSLTHADEPKVHQDLRLYRINKDGISDRFWFTRGKARKLGCQNLLKKSRLHRAVQFGYSSCRIYTKKNCAPESILSFTRDDDSTPTIDLLQGYSWFTVSENKRGERVKSWLCSNQPIASH